MKNNAASILARLKNVSREEERAYNFVLEDFAIARLSASAHKDSFILKRAQLFKIWSDSPPPSGMPTSSASTIRLQKN